MILELAWRRFEDIVEHLACRLSNGAIIVLRLLDVLRRVEYHLESVEVRLLVEAVEGDSVLLHRIVRVVTFQDRIDGGLSVVSWDGRMRLTRILEALNLALHLLHFRTALLVLIRLRLQDILDTVLAAEALQFLLCRQHHGPLHAHPIKALLDPALCLQAHVRATKLASGIRRAQIHHCLV